MAPDLIVLGDSHPIALKAGADLLGLRAEGLHFSGSRWHDGHFVHGADGFEPRGVRSGMLQLRSLREKLGVRDVLALGVPVVSTIGFHLGRLVPPFGWHGHKVQATEEAPITEGLTASRALAEEYVAHYRGRHIRVARRIARKAPLIVVAPPPAFQRSNYDVFRQIITEQMTRAGITVYDMRQDLLPEGGILPPDLLEADGTHATAQCGAMVLTALIERGMLRVKSA